MRNQDFLLFLLIMICPFPSKVLNHCLKSVIFAFVFQHFDFSSAPSSIFMGLTAWLPWHLDVTYSVCCLFLSTFNIFRLVGKIVETISTRRLLVVQKADKLTRQHVLENTKFYRDNLLFFISVCYRDNQFTMLIRSLWGWFIPFVKIPFYIFCCNFNFKISSFCCHEHAKNFTSYVLLCVHSWVISIEQH